MHLTRTSNPGNPALDMAITGALLRSAAARRSPDTVRLFRPGPTVAFGRLDQLRPGCPAAREIAIAHGFTPVLREAGGHAAAYDQGSLLLEIVRREEHTFGDLDGRFAHLAMLIRDALLLLGIAVTVGALQNEYCPGRFSLHLPRGPKIAGIAQRIINGASLTTAVLAVSTAADIPTVTADVYAALELPLDRATVGALRDHHPQIDVERVANAIATKLVSGA